MKLALAATNLRVRVNELAAALAGELDSAIYNAFRSAQTRNRYGSLTRILERVADATDDLAEHALERLAFSRASLDHDIDWSNLTDEQVDKLWLAIWEEDDE